ALSEAAASGAAAETAGSPTDLSALGQLLLGPAAGLLVWFLPLGLEPRIQQAYAIVLFMIVYWIAEPVEHAVTALIGCYLFWALGVVQFSTAFSGFASTSPWFIFGGALIAEAASSTGLARRLGYRVLSLIGTSYSRLLLGVTTLSFLITCLIPSGSARLTIIASMLIGIITASGSGANGNLGRGLFLVVTATCGLFDKMILAGAGSILTHGILKEQTGIEVLWSQWFIAFLPAALLTIPACWLIVLRLYPPDRAESPQSREYLHQTLREMGSLSAQEKKVLAVVGAAIALWATDFIHHLDPTAIGLGAGLALALPRVGVLNADAVKKINFLHLAFAAGAISLANVLIQTRALAAVNGIFMETIGPLLSNAFFSSIALYWGGVLYHFIFPGNQALLTTSLPVLLHVSDGAGYNPVAVALIWAFSGGGTLFPFQSPVLVLGYSYGYFSARDLVKINLILAVVEGILLMALVPLYWPLIGLHWIK
ncbi:MAG TPA: SLC13 family permease, partial [Candidatus Binatia bacterium]